jgi:hypothetical protein
LLYLFVIKGQKIVEFGVTFPNLLALFPEKLSALLLLIELFALYDSQAMLKLVDDLIILCLLRQLIEYFVSKYFM